MTPEEVMENYPQDGNPHVENQHVGKPQLDSSHVGNQPQLNTKEVNTKEENTNGASTDGYATAPAKAALEKKGTYGRYRNVKLTDTDLSKLKAEFPDDWQERIDRLSTYMDRASSAPPSRNWRQMAISRESAYVMTRAKSSIGFGLSRTTGGCGRYAVARHTVTGTSA